MFPGQVLNPPRACTIAYDAWTRVRDTNTTRTRIQDTAKFKKIRYGKTASNLLLLYIDKFIKYQNHQVKQHTTSIL